MRHTSAWPLALVFVALVVYASLYPFMGWRDQGLSPWFVFVESRTPRGTLFDWGVNVVGYMPLGFLLCLGWLRTWPTGLGPLWAVVIGGLLSVLMETLQIYLPVRVPSALDMGLNTLGVALGVLLAWGLERLGAIARWSQFRAHWFVPEASGALVLLALWPVALLFPTPVPLGLGQALEPLTAWAHNLQLRLDLVDSSPVVPAVRPALSANGVGLGVVLGVLMPCLLVYAVSPQPLRRAVLAVLGWGLGLGMTGVSTVFSYGPLHAWGWLTARRCRSAWGWVCCWRWRRCVCPCGSALGCCCWCWGCN